MMKIVIADDSYLLRDRIKFLLKSINIDTLVYEAADGLEALRLIDEVKPDLVILDIRMPEMNGINVMKKVRESKLQVKICILTNYNYPQYKLKCYEAGADFFLSKTDEFEDIKDVIANMINKICISE
jgi:two-component system, NarL family, nitrate/nitrite response regulator NarL